MVSNEPIMTFAKRTRTIFPLTVLALMAGLAVATQDVAGAFHYPQEFGRGLADIGPVRIYPPWVFADWYLRYERSYHGSSTKRACRACWRPSCR
jgi:quinol-cytochrome oxidoreductase complex cytochrome b subunit